MQLVSRENAKSFTTKDGAEMVADVLRGLTPRRNFSVFEITGGGFQIQVWRPVVGDTEVLGWYADDVE